jgi:hypothetical protein
MAWATAATHKLLPRSARSEARAKWERQERQERKRDTCAAAEAQPQAEAGAKVDAGMQQQQQHQHQDQVWEVPASLRQQRVYTLHFTSRLLQQLRRAHKARGEWALSGADASQLMYALGRLKYRAPAGQRAWLVKQVVKTAGQQGLTAKQAALVLWGMGRLGWRKPAAVAALRGVLVRERLYLRPAYAAAALAGLARLGWKDGAIIEAACKVGGGQGGVCGPVGQSLAGVEPVWAACSAGLGRREAASKGCTKGLPRKRFHLHAHSW